MTTRTELHTRYAAEDAAREAQRQAELDRAERAEREAQERTQKLLDVTPVKTQINEAIDAREQKVIEYDTPEGVWLTTNRPAPTPREATKLPPEYFKRVQGLFGNDLLHEVETAVNRAIALQLGVAIHEVNRGSQDDALWKRVIHAFKCNDQPIHDDFKLVKALVDRVLGRRK